MAHVERNVFQRTARAILPTPLSFPYGLLKEKFPKPARYIARGGVAFVSLVEASGIYVTAKVTPSWLFIPVGAIVYWLGKKENLEFEDRVREISSSEDFF